MQHVTQPFQSFTEISCVKYSLRFKGHICDMLLDGKYQKTKHKILPLQTFLLAYTLQ